MAGDENLRIGDAERDEAITLLREHMSAGRITAEEFDERMSSALTAKTKGELTALFNDLPGRGPSTMYGNSGIPTYGASGSPALFQNSTARIPAKRPPWATYAIWAAAILGCVIFFRYWAGFLVLILLLNLAFSRRSNNSSDQILQQQPRELHPAERDELVALIHQDRKIAAIKRYREMTGANLLTAKNAVEALQNQLGM
ncbi:DUF1707 domain-containing protein [[Pseudopropionibacterium] massiliense]|jgi:ribosomal protein L7/L12 C-terminal domain|uniref:DUF1707 domain-containing protein n=1 Tax=[Pseudopropionibacterium] massiliense TaxID=2220000 RepID=UPI0013EF55C6|nr:DUF1707 domain-containing protein [[Pseudopropionibacterium] massiliense]